MGVLRIAAVVSLALVLCGCNRVVSSEPWFTREDAAGAPKLRDGLWVGLNETNCRFDETKPAERWPDCAGALFVRGDQWLTIEWAEQGEGRKARRIFSKWVDLPIVLANGDPLILQYENVETPPPDPEDDENGGVAEKSYYYGAIRPTERDDAGKVTRFESWDIICGPAPMPVAEGDDDEPVQSRYVTEQPFPGLTILDNNCTAESESALRGTAVLSEALTDKPLQSAHWVRDGWR